MFVALILSQLLRECAPNVGTRTMTALIRVESGGQPLAIHDNTLSETFVPHDAAQGVVWANQLLALHHSVDLGLSQINAVNLPRLGMTVREAFDPCININGGATILASDYHAAASKFGPGQYALRRALGAYNSGSLYAGYAYVLQILTAAGVSAQNDFVPNLQRVGLPRPSSRKPVLLERRASNTPLSADDAATPPGPSNPYGSAILVPMGTSATPAPAVTPAPTNAPPAAPVVLSTASPG